MTAGRPLKFKSEEELRDKIEEYFALCETKERKPLITELAYHLDTSRQTLCNYEEKEEFFDTIKRAKQRCEIELERNLIEGKVNPTGSIFNLKNNYGWKDETHNDFTSKGEKLSTLGAVILPQKNESNLETTGEAETSSC